MRLREKRFPRRRRLRLWWRKGNKRKRRSAITKLVDWWNRRQFYAFHNDEIITHKHNGSFPLLDNDQYEEDEWNNESESEDPEQYSDTTSKNDVMEDKASLAGTSDHGEDDVETLTTIEEDSPLDDSLVTIEEEASLDGSAGFESQPKVDTAPPKQPPPPQTLVSPATIMALRRATIDSVSGSLESIDSLVSSQWDPEDDASTVTPLVTNIHPTNDAFFVEHVRFLQIQTQPRTVEEVFHHDGQEKPASE